MIEQRPSERPLFKVFDQTGGDKVVEARTPVLGSGQRGRRVARHLEQGPHRMQFGERRFSFGQLDGGYAQRPDVTPHIVRVFELLLASDHLVECYLLTLLSIFFINKITQKNGMFHSN